MKYLLLLILFTGLSASSINAQDIDYDRIIYPDSATNIPFAEKLVRLAWKNHPANRTIENQVLMSENELAITKRGWINLVTFAFNVNQFTINPGLYPEGNYYPTYNLSLRIPIGQLFTMPKTIKNSEMDYENSLQNLKQNKLELRAEVLTRYQNYLTAKTLLDMQTSFSENEESAFVLLEQRFINNEVDLDEYNSALTRLNNERIKSINLESSYLITKINLESLIGIPLEEVQ